MKHILITISGVLIIFLVYFFSMQLQKLFSSLIHKVTNKVGKFSKAREYVVQRYIFLHRGSIVSKVYNWINAQLIATNLKRLGVTPVGYLIYWASVGVVLSVILTFLFGMDIGSMVLLSLLMLILCLVVTRVVVASTMERRESEVMDAVDLIIPEISNGVKNAITLYIDNFAPSIRLDFKAFLSNIQDRGYSFEDAMYVLSDSLGSVFHDFAQKAIFFEQLGEPDMVDIFTDILETNRNRRQLRYENSIRFSENKMAFITSTAIVFAYLVFILSTDEFSREFLLNSNAGRFVLLIVITIVIGVLSYLTTIRSKTI